ncbi:MAG: pyridoxal phosphate-dependent aminotransferase [Deltaproteobacteria bacterium]|nr:pyridoxal phosphate-dependent aminotransferase [Deltaproteobacteria bacterium]
MGDRALLRCAVIASRVMRISSRVEGIGESQTLRVARLARELKERGVDVIDFSVGQPDFSSPAGAVQAASRALEEGFTRYTANTGILPLREALAESYHRRHGSPWTPGEVMVTVGAKMGLFELSLALFQSGDEVVLPSPYWVSLPEQIRFSGAQPVLVEASPADGFRLHAEALIAAMTKRTRAVLLNTPCNPTGGTIGEEDLRKLVEACASRDIVLIADETYERFVYGGRAPVSAAALAAEFPETVIVVGSFSKTYAMTGWRLGYVLANKAVITALSKIQSHATSNPTSFAMAGAVEALLGGEEEWLLRLQEFEARRALLMPLLEDLPGVRCQPPAGAFYAFPDITGCYRPGCDSSLTMSEWLLEEARVAVVPGQAFGREGHIRMSFACSREELRKGLERIGEALAKHSLG